MADNDELDLGGEDTSSAPSKKSGAGGLFTGLLKWIIIGLAAVIVIVVVVVVTFNVANNNNSAQNSIPYSEEYASGQREILDWYQSIGVIQTTSNDDIPATVRVNVYLGYKKDDKATSTEITARTVEIKDFLRRYFSGKTASELKNVNNEENLKNEIKNGINDKILSSSRIRNVVFEQKDVIEQN